MVIVLRFLVFNYNISVAYQVFFLLRTLFEEIDTFTLHLMTSRNQNPAVCSSCVERKRYEPSVKLIQ
jgi:hypothetical protein